MNSTGMTNIKSNSWLYLIKVQTHLLIAKPLASPVRRPEKKQKWDGHLFWYCITTVGSEWHCSVVPIYWPSIHRLHPLYHPVDSNICVILSANSCYFAIHRLQCLCHSLCGFSFVAIHCDSHLFAIHCDSHLFAIHSVDFPLFAFSIHVYLQLTPPATWDSDSLIARCHWLSTPDTSTVWPTEWILMTARIN